MKNSDHSWLLYVRIHVRYPSYISIIVVATFTVRFRLYKIHTTNLRFRTQVGQTPLMCVLDPPV